MSVYKLKKLYRELSNSIFVDKFWKLGILAPRFPSEPVSRPWMRSRSGDRRELRRSMHFLLRPRGDGEHPNGVGGLAVDPKRSTFATFALSYNADVSAEWNGKTDQTVRLRHTPQPIGLPS